MTTKEKYRVLSVGDDRIEVGALCGVSRHHHVGWTVEGELRSFEAVEMTEGERARSG